MEIKEALKIAVRYIRRTNKSQTHAIDKLWDNELSKLSRSAREELAKYGFQMRLHALLSSGTDPESLDRPAAEMKVAFTEVEAPRAQMMTVRILEHTIFAVEDGSRPLLHFRIEDCDFRIAHNSAQIAGLQRHNEGFALAKSLLRKYRAAEISKLPAEQQSKFAESWKAITQPPAEKEKETVSVLVPTNGKANGVSATA